MVVEGTWFGREEEEEEVEEREKERNNDVSATLVFSPRSDGKEPCSVLRRLYAKPTRYSPHFLGKNGPDSLDAHLGNDMLLFLKIPVLPSSPWPARLRPPRATSASSAAAQSWRSRCWR